MPTKGREAVIEYTSTSPIPIARSVSITTDNPRRSPSGRAGTALSIDSAFMITAREA